MYRGHLSRRRVGVLQRLDYEMTGWTEVRDEEAGERWFYNTITDESRWDPPIIPSYGKSVENGNSAAAPTAPTAEDIFARSRREFVRDTDGSSSQRSRPSSTSSLPPLGGSSRADSLASTILDEDDLLRPSSSNAKMQKGGKAKQLPPLLSSSQTQSTKSFGEDPC